MSLRSDNCRERGLACPIIIGQLDLPTCQAESDEPPLSLAAMATVRDPDGTKLTLHRRTQH